MSFEDHQRGDRQGYSGFVTAPAKNADEMLGRAAGAQRRDFERTLANKASEGYEPVFLPLRFVLLVLGLVAAAFMGVRIAALALLLVAVGGLMATPWVRRLLRGLTPIYVAAMVGLCMSAVTLITSGAPVIADNVLIYPGLAAVVGVIYVVVRTVLRRRSR